MPQCDGLTQRNTRCSRILPDGVVLCSQHQPKALSTTSVANPKIAGKRTIGNFAVFDSNDPQVWEDEYAKTMNPKYAKNTRNFSTALTGREWTGQGVPPIFLVPRARGGPGYTSVQLENMVEGDVLYASVSKGYHMQDVSSFTLGPIIGEGLVLVNSAFSKSICVMHIEGGGAVDLSRKSFWRPSRTPTRTIQLVSDIHMLVDGQLVNIHGWLKTNEALWLPEWEKWRKSIALSSEGSFHWTDNSPTVAYRYQGRYLNFVEWKKECYIRPSYELLPSTRVYQFLLSAWKEHRRPLGLVHPKAIGHEAEKPITKEYLRELFDSPEIMCCMPFCLAGSLMGVRV